MATSDDAAFEAWLHTLPGLGYPRLWIGNNVPALRKRFREKGGEPMPPCPEHSQSAYDPYRGL